jgi:hypothetical protein
MLSPTITTKPYTRKKRQKTPGNGRPKRWGSFDGDIDDPARLKPFVTMPKNMAKVRWSKTRSLLKMGVFKKMAKDKKRAEAEEASRKNSLASKGES